MLSFRILLRAKELPIEEVNHLIIGKVDPNPSAMPDPLKSFITDQIWAACKGLELLPVFQGFCSSLESDIL